MPRWGADLTLGSVTLLWWVNNHDLTSHSPSIFSELVKEAEVEFHKVATRSEGL